MKTHYIELSKSDPKWNFLFNFSNPPQRIFILTSELKNLDLLKNIPEFGLGVVGTRHPSQRILYFLSKQIPLLKYSKIITLSGFAKGIDQHCHKLSVINKVPTIAILGCGINIDYPKNSDKLKMDILSNGGLIISEFPNDVPPYASNFLKRNRLIAAWSKCVWIAESKIPSGALNTAYWARQYDKNCYSTPSFPDDPYSRGNQKLLDEFQAYPYWGIHSLGSTWLELSSFIQADQSDKINFHDIELQEMLTHLKNNICLDGFMSLQKLVETLVNNRWTFNQVYNLIHRAKKNGVISVDHGIVNLISH